jgi:hypothetical protein
VTVAKVYVSSTVADLRAERQAVLEWLRLARHQAVDSYLPASATVRDSCLADVADCDLYVLIVGHLYGFQPEADNPEGLSITQLEFRQAGKYGIPRVALLRTSIPDVRVSDLQDPARAPLVLGFRDEVAGAVRAAEFADLQGLIAALSTGVQGELAKLARREERRDGQAAAGVAARLAPPTPWTQTPFIPRPSLDEQFNSLWNTKLVDPRWTRPNAFCLVGEPGTGKSRYLRELTVLTDGAWISAGSSDALSISLADALGRYDIPIASLDTPALKRAFGNLLTQPTGPSLVIIDDVSDPQEIDTFIPQTTQTRLVISSRTRPAEDWSPVLRVGDLAPAEAVTLIRVLLPDIDTPAADSLAAALGYRPLAIVQACALVRRSPTLSAMGLTRALIRDTATALQSLPSRPDSALTVIYRQMLAGLREDFPDSYRLLSMLAVMPPLYVPAKLLAGPITEQLAVDADDRTLSGLRARGVTEPLRQLCLLDEDDLGIRLSTLTQDIVRGLLSDEDLMTAMNTYNDLANGDSFALLSAGWSTREVASLGVIEELYFKRVEELIAARATPAEIEVLPIRQGISLTSDQWSALTEALWERTLRIVVVADLLMYSENDARSLDSLMQQYSAEFSAMEQIEASIPGRAAWEAEFNSFDPDDFMHWLATNETIDRENHRARISEDFETGLKILVQLYQLSRGLNAFMTNPIVETRLGRFDLREIYPPPEPPE